MSAHAGSTDALTRTTLEIGGTASRASIAGMTYALRHVPGVLLADVNSGGAAVVVAHDGAVSVSALVAAASDAGVVATVSGAAVAISSQPQHSRRLVLAMSTIAAAFVFAALLIPNPTQRSLTINALVIAVWIWYFAGIFLRRKA